MQIIPLYPKYLLWERIISACSVCLSVSITRIRHFSLPIFFLRKEFRPKKLPKLLSHTSVLDWNRLLDFIVYCVYFCSFYNWLNSLKQDLKNRLADLRIWFFPYFGIVKILVFLPHSTGVNDDANLAFCNCFTSFVGQFFSRRFIECFWISNSKITNRDEVIAAKLGIVSLLC